MGLLLFGSQVIVHRVGRVAQKATHPTRLCFKDSGIGEIEHPNFYEV